MTIAHSAICRGLFINTSLFLWMAANRKVYWKHNPVEGIIVCFYNEYELIGYEVAGKNIKFFHNHRQSVRYHLLRGILRSELR